MSVGAVETGLRSRPRTAAATSEPSREAMYERGPGRYFVLTLLIVAALLTLFPFFLAAINAVKSPVDYGAHGPLALPHSFDLTALQVFWREVNFGEKLFNSVLISAAVAVFGVAISLLNAYALGIGRVRGRHLILVVFLMGIMVPQEALIYPIYYIAKAVGLYDTRLSVIIVFSVLQGTFGTYLVSAVLTAFPREIVDAAHIDGASRWQVLWHVVVPMLRPTLTVLATFFFIWTWNEFLLPLVLLISNDNQNVSIALGTLHGQYTSEPTTTAAAALLGIIPTVLFFLVFQRTLMRGITVGAIK
jgi:raffinose/stachyose/melibiose transport system permease protein